MLAVAMANTYSRTVIFSKWVKPFANWNWVIFCKDFSSPNIILQLDWVWSKWWPSECVPWTRIQRISMWLLGCAGAIKLRRRMHQHCSDSSFGIWSEFWKKIFICLNSSLVVGEKLNTSSGFCLSRQFTTHISTSVQPFFVQNRFFDLFY